VSAAGVPAGAAAPAITGPSESGADGAGAPPSGRSYGSGARILSIGLALTGVVTLGFFVLASHALGDDAAYGRVSLLWAITFMITSVIYRPIEQLLARTIAESRALGGGFHPGHSLRTPIMLQSGSAITFVLAALIFRGSIEDNILGGDTSLYWVLVGAVAAYSLSYFARGWLAGSGRPELYGALVFIESSARCLFPIVALLGISHGTLAVALGIAAAPLLSLAVVPLALRGGVGAPVGSADVAAPSGGAAVASSGGGVHLPRRHKETAAEARAARDAARARANRVSEVAGAPVDEDLVAITPAEAEALGATTRSTAESLATEAQTTSPATGAPGLSLRAGAIFAGSTVVVMLAEQILITAGVLTVGSSSGSGLKALAGAGAAGAAGAVFNAFLVSRAPLQLFQAVQSTLLPHLAALSTSGDREAAAKALRTTMLVIAAFAAVVTLGLLAIGPWGMSTFFKTHYDYTRGALALVGLGMGLHLAAGTLNQSALAHGRAPVAAAAWAVAAVLFLIWMFADPLNAEPVLRAASGYAIAAGVLLAGLLGVERQSLRA
jgi:O-antigen/teichoic acid export membrane protein